MRHAAEGVEADQLVRSYLGDEPQSIINIVEYSRMSGGTVRPASKRLLDAELVTRCWDGNSRFDRYLYRATN